MNPHSAKSNLSTRPSSEVDLIARPSETGCFLPLIYEDEDLLVLNKSSGVPSIPHSSEETHTAVSAALAHCPQIQGIGYGPLEPGILHRLDNETSGVLVFAKAQKEFDRLKEIWKTPQVRKFYKALSLGEAPIPKTPQTIRWHLAHSAKSSKRMLAFSDLHSVRKNQIKGKPLPTCTHLLNAHPLTQYTFPSPLSSVSLVEFELEIETGVMHQIRCTLAGMKWPILGDPIYRLPSSLASVLSEFPRLLPAHFQTRLWLHAEKLQLPLASGKTLIFKANIPENWPLHLPLPSDKERA